MREKLSQYIDLLFSHAALTVENAELKEEILQNTLERYDDLLKEGRTEQEAYRITVDGIGDLSGLIELEKPSYAQPLYEKPAPVHPDHHPAPASKREDGAEQTFQSKAANQDTVHAKRENAGMQSAIWLLATAAYFWLSFRTGAWHITWIIFLIAPALSCIAAGAAERRSGAEAGAGKAVAALWLLTAALYIVLSFASGAWHLTWILFLIAGAATGLLHAIYDWRS